MFEKHVITNDERAIFTSEIPKIAENAILEIILLL